MEDVQAAMKDSMAQTLALMQTQMLPMVQAVTEEQQRKLREQRQDLITKKKADDDELAAGAELDRQKQLWPDRTLFADTEVRLRGGKDRQPLREVEIVRLQVDQGSLAAEDGARLIVALKRGSQVLPTPPPPTRHSLRSRASCSARVWSGGGC